MTFSGIALDWVIINNIFNLGLLLGFIVLVTTFITTSYFDKLKYTKAYTLRKLLFIKRYTKSI